MGLKLKKLTSNLETIATLGLNKALNPGSSTVEQVPLETPEQKAARLRLTDFMNTGKFGAFTAGEDVGIKPGSYGMTDLETSGQSALQKLLMGGIPDQFRMGDEALASILNPDPNYVSSQFDPFRAQVQREVDKSTTALKRGAAFSGNLYSTNTVKRLGDIQTRANETLTAELARLTDNALNRRAAAIPLAYQSGMSQENIARGRIDASQAYGGLSRNLENQGIAERNAEILRRRNELLLPLNAASSVAGTNANFGLPSVTTQNPNPMLDLLTALISGGSKIAAAKGAG